VFLELGIGQALRHVADAAMPADRGDAPAEVFVHPLGPDAHLRPPKLSAGRSDLGRVCVFRYSQITVDLVTTFPVHQRRHLPARVDGLEPVRMMLENRRVQAAWNGRPFS
jgi:hypothetical protein